MKVMKVTGLIAAAMISVFALLIAQNANADALDDIKAAKKIRIAIDLGLPPYGMTDDKMQPTGSDVETVCLPRTSVLSSSSFPLQARRSFRRYKLAKRILSFRHIPSHRSAQR